jgi:glycine hydroxymethyltransferase
VGTPAVTTLGMGEKEMQEISSILKLAIANTKPEFSEKENGPSKAKYILAPAAKAEARERVAKLLKNYPVYPELDLNFLQSSFKLN